MMFKGKCKEPLCMSHFSFLFWTLSKTRLLSQADSLIAVVIFSFLFVHVFLELHNLKLYMTIQLRYELVPPAKVDLSAVRWKMSQILCRVKLELHPSGDVQVLFLSRSNQHWIHGPAQFLASLGRNTRSLFSNQSCRIHKNFSSIHLLQ